MIQALQNLQLQVTCVVRNPNLAVSDHAIPLQLPWAQCITELIMSQPLILAAPPANFVHASKLSVGYCKVHVHLCWP